MSRDYPYPPWLCLEAKLVTFCLSWRLSKAALRLQSPAQNAVCLAHHYGTKILLSIVIEDFNEFLFIVLSLEWKATYIQCNWSSLIDVMVDRCFIVVIKAWFLEPVSDLLDPLPNVSWEMFPTWQDEEEYSPYSGHCRAIHNTFHTKISGVEYYISLCTTLFLSSCRGLWPKLRNEKFPGGGRTALHW